MGYEIGLRSRAAARLLLAGTIALVCALLVAATARAADPAPNSPYGDASVQTVDLSGTWNFTPLHPAAPGTTIQVPGGGWYKQGFTKTQEAVYTRQITIPTSDRSEVTKLEFGAVNNQATLTLSGPGLPAGGQVVGTNMTAFMPSSFDLTPYVEPGKTYTISVDVIGRLGFQETSTPEYAVPDAAEWQAAIPQGIFRSAELKIYRAVYVSDAAIDTSVAHRSLSYTVSVTNESDHSQRAVLGGRLSSWNRSGWRYPRIPTKTVTVPANSTIEVTVGPLPWAATPASYWWPNIPYRAGYRAQLHLLRLTASTSAGPSSSSYRFGFRTFTQDGTHYELNGIRVRLRGDDLQGADYDGIVNSIVPGSPSASTGAGDAYDTLPGFLPPDYNHDRSPGWPRAVENYQRLNYTFVRLHQEPVTPYMLDVLDEKGLMVADETPIRGSNGGQDFTNGTVTPALGVGVSTNPFNNMLGSLAALIDRDRDHAAIMKWSLMNEVSGQPALQVAAYKDAQSLDPTRPDENESTSTGPTGAPQRGDYYDTVVSGTTTLGEEPNYANFSHYLTYCDVAADGIHPSGQGEFQWPDGSSPQGFEMFGTETECMREQDAADIRPYALESGWLGFVPGVKTTDLTLEEGRPAVFGADDLSDPWSNPIIQRIQAGFNPLLVADSAYWRLNDLPGPNGQWPNGRYPQTLVYGQTVKRLLTVFNDTFSSSPVTLGWQARLGSPDGPLVSQGSETLRIAPGTDLQAPVTFTAPVHGTTMYLVLSSSINGRQTFRESHEVFDLAAEAAAPLVTDDNSVSNPTPTTLTAAAAAGQSDITVASTNGLTASTQISIDSGADQESATIQSVGTDGTDITLASPLQQSHDAGATVTPAPANDKWTYSANGPSDWAPGSNFLDGGNIPGTTATGSPAGIPVSTFSSSSKANATATLRFSGTKITVYGWTALNYGIASISLDGGAPTTFDEGPANPNTLLFPAGATPTSTPGADPSQIPNGISAFFGFFGGYSQAVPMYTSPQLPSGLHTLVVTVTGTHDAAATGSTVAIDSAIASEPAATSAGPKQ